MVIVVLFHALLALLPLQSWAQGPQILGVGGNLTVYSPDFVNVQASAGNVTLQSSEYVNIVSPAVTLSGTLSVSTVASSGNLTVTAGDFLALSAPTVVLSGNQIAFDGPVSASAISAAATSLLITAPQAITLNASTIEIPATNVSVIAASVVSIQSPSISLNAPTGVVTASSNTLTLSATQTVNLQGANIVLDAASVDVQGALGSTTSNLAVTASNVLELNAASLTLNAPSVAVQGTLSSTSSNLAVTVSNALSLNAASLTLNAASVAVHGSLSSTTNNLAITASNNLSLTAPNLILNASSIVMNGPGTSLSTGAVNASSVFSSTDIFAGTGLHGASLSLTGTGTNTIAGSLTVSGGFTTEGSVSVLGPLTVNQISSQTAIESLTLDASSIIFNAYIQLNVQSLIAVASASALVAAWNQLQGQPLTNLVTIQLSASFNNDLTNIVLSNLVSSSLIIVEGLGTTMTTLTVPVVLSNIQNVLFRNFSLVCVSSPCSLPAISLVNGAAVNIYGIAITGTWGEVMSNLIPFPSTSFLVASDGYIPSQITQLILPVSPASTSVHIEASTISSSGGGIMCIGKVGCVLSGVTVNSVAASMAVVASYGAHLTVLNTTVSNDGGDTGLMADSSFLYVGTSTMISASGPSASCINMVSGTLRIDNNAAITFGDCSQGILSQVGSRVDFRSGSITLSSLVTTVLATYDVSQIWYGGSTPSPSNLCTYISTGLINGATTSENNHC